MSGLISPKLYLTSQHEKLLNPAFLCLVSGNLLMNCQRKKAITPVLGWKNGNRLNVQWEFCPQYGKHLLGSLIRYEG